MLTVHKVIKNMSSVRYSLNTSKRLFKNNQLRFGKRLLFTSVFFSSLTFAAEQFTVTSNQDGSVYGQCTLRDAIKKVTVNPLVAIVHRAMYPVVATALLLTVVFAQLF